MPPMCIIFGTFARVSRRMRTLTVSAPGAHTWSRRVNRRNTKGFFHATVGESHQIRQSHKRRRFRTKPDHWTVIGRARKSPLFQWRLNVRLKGLFLAGMLVSTGAMVAHAVPLGSDIGHRATTRAAGIVTVWDGCGWVGIWCPVIGVSGAVRGFRRSASPTVVTALGLPIAVGEVLTAVGNHHTADGNPTAAGKAHTEAPASPVRGSQP
jgi:hypothetical protein